MPKVIVHNVCNSWGVVLANFPYAHRDKAEELAKKLTLGGTPAHVQPIRVLMTKEEINSFLAQYS